MGTSMSDSKSALQGRYAQRGRIVESEVKKHQSLKKITLRGITQGSKAMSQTKICQNQISPKPITKRINKKIEQEYYQNDNTPAFSVDDKKSERIQQLPGQDDRNELKRQANVLQSGEGKNKCDENYFQFVKKSSINKKASQPKQNSDIVEQSQLKLPLSSLLKENLEIQHVSFSENPSSQKTNRKTSEIKGFSQRPVIDEVLNSVKQHKKEIKRINKDTHTQKKIERHYFNYGLTNIQIQGDGRFLHKGEQQVKNSKDKKIKAQPLKISSKYKQIINRETKKIQKNQLLPSKSAFNDYYQTYSNERDHQRLNQEANANTGKESTQKSQLKSQLNTNGSYFRRKLSSNVSSSSKAKSEKRLNLIYF